MAENDQKVVSQYSADCDCGDESVINLLLIWKVLRPNWKVILYWAAAAFVIGCIMALLTPRQYKVTSKLAPELSSSSSSSRISSLASLVGMSSLMTGTSDAVYPSIYPEVLGSGFFLAELFDLPVTFTEKKVPVTVSFYEYLTEHQKKSPAGALMSVPGAVMSLFKGEKNDSSDRHIDPYRFTRKQGRVIRALSHNITAAVDKKTMVLTLTVNTQDPVVSATVSRAVIENLKRYVTEYRTEKSKKDCAYYEKLHKEAQDAYYAALQEYSDYVDSHQGVRLQGYTIESTRLKNEASLKYELYNDTAQQLQMARAKVQLETPVVAELVSPAVPTDPSNSKRKMAMGYGFFGFILGVAYLLWKHREEWMEYTVEE